MSTKHTEDGTSPGGDADETKHDERAVEPVAAIDIGSNSIRMAIAQIDHAGEVQVLETLHKPVTLGHDTFTSGKLSTETIESCVDILQSFSKILREYGITSAQRIRAIATSAVREASNREIFLDRMYIATGIQVEAIEETEVTRLTYLSVLPHLENNPEFSASDTMILEVGGGSTELLLLREGHIAFSNTFRMGTLRFHEALQSFRTAGDGRREMIESHIQRTVQQVSSSVPITEGTPHLILLGGEARFAAKQLATDAKDGQFVKIPVSALLKFTEQVIELSEDDLVKKYGISFSDASTLVPALLTHVAIAKAYRIQDFWVTDRTIRDGLLEEIAAGGAWTEEFKAQIIQSALDLGKKFHFDENHARQVMGLSVTLFDALQEEHHLESRYRLHLKIAALLHEIGLHVSTRSHHKHSMYLIMHSELFGLSRRDVAIIALIARYHRRAAPKTTHQVYSSLDRESRIIVSKLASILRVADALDRVHSSRIQGIKCRVRDGKFIIGVPNVKNLTMEEYAMREKGGLFEDIFGLTITLRKSRSKVEQ